jgi:hypothetical protein
MLDLVQENQGFAIQIKQLENVNNELQRIYKITQHKLDASQSAQVHPGPVLMNCLLFLFNSRLRNGVIGCVIT